MRSEYKDGALTFFLEGRIDSSNADELEADLKDQDMLFDEIDIAFDMEKLEYISSAGLRVLLKLKKSVKKPVRLVNVSDEVFDILDVTGFGDIFVVERKMRTISLRGCKKISSALNGEIFQLSDDEMIKVYGKNVTLSEVRDERKRAQTAMIYGVPTLIPYDVVRTEEGYGIIYEKAEMTSLAYILSHDPSRVRSCAMLLGKLMTDLHHTEIPEGKLPDIKDRYREWIDEVENLGDSKVAIFSKLIDSIADSNTYVHGDINLNSVMIHKDELILLDMAGSATGHAIFDLQALFASLIAIEKRSEGYCRRTYGLSANVCSEFWSIFFDTYMQHRQQEIKSMNELLARYFVLKEDILNKVERKNRLRMY